jgi:hypothetical protein
MKAHRALFFFLLVGCYGFSAGQTQVPAQESVSSDDISVADGLQLPTYGHVWVLDSWKGLHELVRLRPPDNMADGPSFSLKARHAIEFKNEAAIVRVHDVSPSFFVRGVTGNDPTRSDLVAVRLVIDGQRRVPSRDALSLLKQPAKRQGAKSPDILEISQQRVGTTDWYRLSLHQPLAPGEYALIPLPGAPGFAEGEMFDFAIDPNAPENADPVRSEQYRGTP